MKNTGFLLFMAGLCAAASIVGAAAADFALALESAKPAATITLPDSWKSKSSVHGVEGQSDDGSSFIVAKMLKPDEKAASDYNVEIITYFQSQGVAFTLTKDDADPKTTDSEMKINGLETLISRLDEPTSFKGAPTTVTYYAIPIGSAQTLNIVTRGPRDDKTLASIVATVKALP